MKSIVVFLVFLFSVSSARMNADVAQQTIEKLVAIQGESNRARVEKGVMQVAQLWQPQDGSDQEFMDFCDSYFIADSALLQQTLARFETNLEIIFGHALEVARDLSRPIQLETGDILAVDYPFSEYDPYAHIQDDLFKTKIAFIALLNYPIYSLEERLKEGPGWSRSEWAQTRLAQGFSHRVPAAVNQQLTRAYVQADDYIANYNIYMHQLVDAKGVRLFPRDLKLISHWGLRDELKSQYFNEDGLARQKMIFTVMERIIKQEIPQQVINSDQFDWDPVANILYKDQQKSDFSSEPFTRYRHLLTVFLAEQLADPYYPDAPSKMQRSFELNREIPEQKYEELISSLLTDPAAVKVAQLISRRLKRGLQPFDIWYNGFKSQGEYDEAFKDQKVTEKYPSVDAFQKDLPNILQALSFSSEKAHFLAGKIIVDPSRGAGHALGAGRREDNAHLRTRIPQGGMKYKGYNIAIHELGHNVEQVFSLNCIDHISLQGVPNTAFTEAFAFVFQSRDLELLGLGKTDPQAEHLKALETFWATCEIGAVGLVDLRVWHWLYDHPHAGEQELLNAVIDISRSVWNEYYAPLFGIKDSIILGIYSHMIDAGLYLPDYSLGHLIMFQIEQYLKGKNLGDEMERMCTIGSVTPDAWMQSAVNSPISAQPLLTAVREALKNVR